jgi:hypothetical protein
LPLAAMVAVLAWAAEAGMSSARTTASPSASRRGR